MFKVIYKYDVFEDVEQKEDEIVNLNQVEDSTNVSVCTGGASGAAAWLPHWRAAKGDASGFKVVR